MHLICFIKGMFYFKGTSITFFIQVESYTLYFHTKKPE